MAMTGPHQNDTKSAVRKEFSAVSNLVALNKVSLVTDLTGHYSILNSDLVCLTGHSERSLDQCLCVSLIDGCRLPPGPSYIVVEFQMNLAVEVEVKLEFGQGRLWRWQGIPGRSRRSN